MKHFDADQNVKARVTEIIRELHELCRTNQLPYVLAVVVKNNDVDHHKIRAAFVDTDMGLADNSLIGACEFLKMPGEAIPAEVINALICKNDDLQHATTEFDIREDDAPINGMTIHAAPKTLQ